MQENRNLLIKEKYGSNIVEFCKRFNPDVSVEIRKKGYSYVDCYNMNYPPIAHLRQAYTDAGMIEWIKIQIDNLNDFVNVKEKITDVQINELANIILYEYSYLNIAELFLFFTRFKSGEFGQFYGSVDPLLIANALKEFISQRLIKINQNKRELEQKKLLSDIEKWNKEGISYDEYLELKNNNSKNIAKY